MDRTRLQIEPGLWLDARRAIWLEEASTLAVSDLHLGYAWAQRHTGQLLPLSAQEDSVPRLRALVDDYQPRELILLGDIVHQAVGLPPLKEELCRLFTELGERTTLRLVAGNHDTHLSKLLADCHLSAPLTKDWITGDYRLIHGDRMDLISNAAAADDAEPGLRIIMGHEHPAISVGDRVSRVKCPCFLISREVIVLPAFSHWAAGTEVLSSRYASPLASRVSFTKAIAILAGKLLPIPLQARL
jgi:DNA ligase-associated metallophosphoesterase